MITAIASALGLSRAMTWVVLSGFLLAALTSGALWLRADAVGDYKAREAAREARDRLEARQDADERERDVKDLDDDGLRDRLLEWLR